MILLFLFVSSSDSLIQKFESSWFSNLFCWRCSWIYFWFKVFIMDSKYTSLNTILKDMLWYKFQYELFSIYWMFFNAKKWFNNLLLVQKWKTILFVFPLLEFKLPQSCVWVLCVKSISCLKLLCFSENHFFWFYWWTTNYIIFLTLKSYGILPP